MESPNQQLASGKNREKTSRESCSPPLVPWVPSDCHGESACVLAVCAKTVIAAVDIVKACREATKDMRFEMAQAGSSLSVALLCACFVSALCVTSLGVLFY